MKNKYKIGISRRPQHPLAAGARAVAAAEPIREGRGRELPFSGCRLGVIGRMKDAKRFGVRQVSFFPPGRKFLGAEES